MEIVNTGASLTVTVAVSVITPIPAPPLVEAVLVMVESASMGANSFALLSQMKVAVLPSRVLYGVRYYALACIDGEWFVWYTICDVNFTMSEINRVAFRHHPKTKGFRTLLET